MFTATKKDYFYNPEKSGGFDIVERKVSRIQVFKLMFKIQIERLLRGNLESFILDIHAVMRPMSVEEKQSYLSNILDAVDLLNIELAEKNKIRNELASLAVFADHDFNIEG